MTEYILVLLACAFCFGAGYLAACLRISRKTGTPLRSVILRGGGN